MNAISAIELRPFPVHTALIVGADAQIEALLRDILDHATALLMVQRKSFDLILTSEKTSGREDIELLRKIRGIRPHTRLIILADDSTPADIITSIREQIG